jgi:hypothetical protein
MNLVKAQELAQSMPQKDLEKYANGFAPHIIPPWLATGEMQAKMQRMQKMQAMEGAAQGPQPSVKEQIEQKAGLMGLQQAQQQMMQRQQMAQRPMAGPVPEGTPEPAAQPTDEVMMASGGLASVPVRFNFDGGGIVAFDGTKGSEVKDKDKEKKDKPTTGSYLGRSEGKNLLPDTSGYEGMGIGEFLSAIGSEGIAKLRNAFSQDESLANKMRKQTLSESVAKNMAEVNKRDPNITNEVLERVGLATRAEQMPQKVIGQKEAPPPAAPPAPPRAQQDVRQPAPQMGPTQTQEPLNIGVPSRPNIPGLNDPAAAAAVATALKAPDQKSLLTENQERLAAMGITGRGGEEQEARIRAARNLYEQSKPSGLDDLIRVFGQAGQYKGLSGTGPAYTALQAQKRADDLKFQEREMELSNAIDVARRSEGIAGANKVGDTLGKLRDTAASTGASVLGSQMSGNVQLANQASSNAVQMQIAKDRNLNSLEVARIQAASANRPGETERIMEAYGALKARDPQKAEEYMRNIERIRGAASGNRGVMTRDQASDNVMKKIAYESPIRNELMKEAGDALKKSGIASPTTSQITEYLISKEMGASGAPASSGRVVDFNALPK